MNIDDYLTHISRPEDLPFLKSKLFDVNIRLLKSSLRYRSSIASLCSYIDGLARTTFEGYKKPHGMSGANAGIPFNIISIVQNRGEVNESVLCMINPKILSTNGRQMITKSNCGSIRLKRQIEILRWQWITIGYFDLNGEYHKESFEPETGAFTIQHEIDHNLGILITDYPKY